ncbi:hypothetical protein [Jeotgalibacillus marinus]|uniref:Uncharacterized protein n=1 Tax=Jeotgalibacillus marinus TaxID=86667 RepID=A0ABV3Q4V8_9BACL
MALKKRLVSCVFLVGNSLFVVGSSPIGAQSKDRTMKGSYEEITRFRVTSHFSVDTIRSFGFDSTLELYQVNKDAEDELFGIIGLNECDEGKEISFDAERGHSYYVIATNSEGEQFVSNTYDVPAENTVKVNILTPTIKGYKPNPFRPDEIAYLDISMNYSDDSSEEVLYVYQVNEETGEIIPVFSLTFPPSRWDGYTVMRGYSYFVTSGTYDGEESLPSDLIYIP